MGKVNMGKHWELKLWEFPDSFTADNFLNKIF